MDLTEFLNARMDEDEHYLRTMIEVGERGAESASPEDLADIGAVAMGVLSDPQARQLLELWADSPVLPPVNPERLLREVEAKRAIVNRCVTRLAVQPARRTGVLSRAAYETLCDLAAVYSGHPDYRDEWRPQ